jgi:uncharacterized membrane protein
MKKPVMLTAVFGFLIILTGSGSAAFHEPGSCLECHLRDETRPSYAERLLAPRFMNIGAETCPALRLAVREAYLTVSRLVKLYEPAKRTGGTVKDDYDRLLSRWLTLAGRPLESAEDFVIGASFIREELDRLVFRPTWNRRQGERVMWSLVGLGVLVTLLLLTVALRTRRVRRLARVAKEEADAFSSPDKGCALFNR